MKIALKTKNFSFLLLSLLFWFFAVLSFSLIRREQIKFAYSEQVSLTRLTVHH